MMRASSCRAAAWISSTAYSIFTTSWRHAAQRFHGIFGGKADKTATLRFTPEQARWVADEKWHPEQEGKWLPDGAYELKIPYQNPRELVMDVMRHGENVEVITPLELREEIKQRLRRAFERYE